MYSNKVYKESLHLVSGVMDDPTAIILENHAMDYIATLGICLNMNRAGLPRKPDDDVYSPSRPGGIYLSLGRSHITGIKHAAEVAPSYYMRTTDGGLREKGQDKFTQGQDKYSQKTDKYSIGEAVRRPPAATLHLPIERKIKTLRDKIPHDELVKAFSKKSSKNLVRTIKTRKAQDGVHAGNSIGQGTFDRLQAAWNKMMNDEEE